MADHSRLYLETVLARLTLQGNGEAVDAVRGYLADLEKSQAIMYRRCNDQGDRINKIANVEYELRETIANLRGELEKTHKSAAHYAEEWHVSIDREAALMERLNAITRDLKAMLWDLEHVGGTDEKTK